MKGALKSIKRAPQAFGSKVGFASKSSDADFDVLVKKFAGLEENASKLIKDCATFREAVANMLKSQVGFSVAFATIFQPILNEASLTTNHPEAAMTLRNIVIYQDLMSELKEAIQPELDLVDNRVITPLREYQDLLKKVRKTVTKRDHKLTDFDRFNNSYNKLKDKKEKSLSDEKNMFKLEQDLETATQDYDHYNNSLKVELPHLLALTTAFISPLFQTFYFIKVGILYTLLEKMQGFTAEMYGELDIQHLEQMHDERLGDTTERIEALTVTKRFVGTARLMSAKQASDSNSTYSSSSLGRAPASSSYASSSYTKTAPPPSRAPASYESAPPPYNPGAAAASLGAATGAKRAAPPPPAPKPRLAPAVPTVTYVTALYDYTAQADGDLSFVTGDRIALVRKTDSSEDWWTGKLHGQEGVFPGNYVQL